MIAGCSSYWPSSAGTPSNGDRVHTFKGDGGTIRHISVAINALMKRYEVWRGDSPTPTLLAVSESNLVPLNTWTHIETRVKIHDTLGEVEVRREESTIISATGLDTRNGGAGTIDFVEFHLQGFGNLGFGWCTDLHIANEQGSLYNSFLGHHRGYWLDPTSQGNYNEQTGSDGNQTDTHLLVDELGVPNDSDYYASATVGHRQTFGMRDLTPTTGTVLALDIRARNLKTDAGAKKLRSLLRRSSTDVAGADWIVDVTADSDHELYDQDPVAAAAWTIANVNATEIGTEIRS